MSTDADGIPWDDTAGRPILDPVDRTRARAQEAVWIERPDLGPGVLTFVQAGALIPREAMPYRFSYRTARFMAGEPDPLIIVSS